MASIKIKFLQAILVGSCLVLYLNSASYSDSLDLGGLNAKNDQVIGNSSDWTKPNWETVVGVLAIEIAPFMAVLGGVAVSGTATSAMSTAAEALLPRLSTFTTFLLNNPTLGSTLLTFLPATLAAATGIATGMEGQKGSSARGEAFTSDVGTVLETNVENEGKIIAPTPKQIIQVAQGLVSSDDAAAAKEKALLSNYASAEKEIAGFNNALEEDVLEGPLARAKASLASDTAAASAQEQVIKGLEPLPTPALTQPAPVGHASPTGGFTFNVGNSYTVSPTSPTFSDNGTEATYHGVQYHRIASFH